MAVISSQSNKRNKPYPPGIHAPTVTFFLEDGSRQEIDWTTQEAHLEFLVESGVHGSKLLPPKTSLVTAINKTFTHHSRRCRL